MAGPSTVTSPAGNFPALKPLGHHAGKPAVAVSRPVFLIGARHNCHLHLLSREVSKAHAVLINDNDGLYIRDLASRTRVYVNGEQIREAYLGDSDLIKIGTFTFKLSNEAQKLRGGHRPELPEAALMVDGADVSVPLEERVSLIGRRATCNIPLLEPSVSTSHAIIFDVNGKRYIRDLGSRTGTWLNGKAIHQAELNFGDQIKIGETTISYVAAGTTVLEEPAMEEAAVEDSVAEVAADAVEVADEEEIAAEPEPKIEGLEELAAALPTEVEPAEQPAELPIEDIAPPAIAPAVESTPEKQPQLTPAAASEFTEIDLSTDPDVSGSNDTAAIPASPQEPARKPVLSSQVVDAPDSIDIEDEPQQLLVDADLHREKLSSSATHTELDHAAEEAIARGTEPEPAEPLAIDQAEPAIDAAEVPEAEISARGGWHRRKRAGANEPAIAEVPQSAEDKPAEPQTEQKEDDVFRLLEIDESNQDGTTAVLDRDAPESGEVETYQPAAEEAAPAEFEMDLKLAPEPVEFGEEIEAPAAPPVAEALPEIDLADLDVSAIDFNQPATAPEEGKAAAPEAPSDELKLADIDIDDEADIVAEQPLVNLEPRQPRPRKSTDQLIELDEVAIPFADDEAAPAPASTSAVDVPQAPAAEAAAGADDIAPLDVAARVEEAPKRGRGRRKSDEADAPVKPSRRGRRKKGEEVPAAEAPAPVEEPPTVESPAATAPAPALAPEMPVPVIEEPAPVAETALLPEVPATGAEAQVATHPAPETLADVEDIAAEALGSVEIIDKTEPTPESALDLETVSPIAEAAPPVVESVLSDTGFGREVNDFIGATGAPVEEAPVAETPAVVEELAVEELPEIEEVTATGASSAEEAISTPSAEAHAETDALAGLEIADEPEAIAEAALPAASVEAKAAEDEEDLQVAPELDELAVNFDLDAVDSPGAALAAEEEEELLELEPTDAEPVAEAAAQVEAPADKDFLEMLDLPVEETAEPPVSAEPLAEAPAPVPAPARADAPKPGLSLSGGSLGANQAGFFGGMALNLPPSSYEIPPASPALPAAAASLDDQAALAGDETAVQPADELAHEATGSVEEALIPAAPAPVQRRTPPPFKRKANVAGRTSNPFDMGPEDVPVRRPDEVPPFKGKGRPTAGRVTTSFDGLAMPPVRETDVFSQQPVAIPEDVVFGTPSHAGQYNEAESYEEQHGDDGDHDAPPVAQRNRPQPPRAARAAQLPPAPPATAPVRKRRRWLGIPFLVLMMLLCMAGAGGGIYGVIHKKSIVSGALPLRNFSALRNELDIKKLEETQSKLLAEATVRDTARDNIVNSQGLAAGFLGEPMKFATLAGAAHLDRAKGAFIFEYPASTDPDDRQRVLAVVAALYSQNSGLMQQSAKLHKAADAQGLAVEQLKKECAQLADQIKDLQTRIDGHLPASDTKSLQKDVDALGQKFQDAKAALVKAQAELEKMPEKPADIAFADAASITDAGLDQLGADLAALKKKIIDTKSAGSDQTIKTRAALGEAIRGYQQKTNTMQAALEEKFVAARDQLFAGDNELKDLKNKRDLASRRYNAAVDGNMGAQAIAGPKTEVADLDKQITARQDVLSNDLAAAGKNEPIRIFIDATQQALADPKGIEDAVKGFLAALNALNAGQENLPDDVKQWLPELQRRFDVIISSADTYGKALGVRAKEVENQVATLQQQVEASQQKIDDRRKELVAAKHQKEIEEATAALQAARLEKQKEIAGLEAAQSGLESELASRTATLNSVVAANAAFEQNENLTSTLTLQRQKLDEAQAERIKSEQDAAAAVEVVLPQAADISVRAGEDPRPLYALISLGAIAALFSIFIFIAHRSSAREADREHIHSLDRDQAFDDDADDVPAASTSRRQAVEV